MYKSKIMFPFDLQHFNDDPGDGGGEKTGTEKELSTDENTVELTQEQIQRMIDNALKAKEEKAKEIEGMSEDEIRQRDLDIREAEILQRELKAEAIIKLQKQELPTGLAELLTYSDEKACDASIVTVAKVFKAELKKAVAEATKGKEALHKPPLDDEEDLGSGTSFVSIIKENQSKR